MANENKKKNNKENRNVQDDVRTTGRVDVDDPDTINPTKVKRK